MTMQQKTTCLAPGQRYADPGERQRQHQATIIRLEPDALGVTQVVFSYRGGRQVVAYVSQVEAAIASGQLVPIAGPGCVGHC